MINRVSANKPLPVSVRRDIVERTDGIPLFVEEITKAVLEAEEREAAERATAAISSPAVAVPASLHASLIARLDRLGSAKELAQMGAAIGREFSHGCWPRLSRKPESELIGSRPTDRSGLLFRQGVPPHASYLFKHALVQDAAYGTLLREGRRACTHASPKRLNANSLTSPRHSPSCWLATALRLDWSQRRRVYGAKPDCGR